MHTDSEHSFTNAIHLINQTSVENDATFSQSVQICRLCASQTERLLDIFSEEGTKLELASKINLYLPVKITITDSLPLQCCTHCVSIVLSWHEFTLISRRTDNEFRSLKIGVPVDEANSSENNPKKIEQLLIESTMKKKLNTPNEATCIPKTNKILLNDSNIFSANEDKFTSDNIKDEKEIKQFNPCQASFECSECQTVYVSKNDLIEHIKNKHPELTNNNENKSLKKAVVKDNLSIKHMFKKPRKKLYKCKECGKFLQSLYSFVIHKRIHTGEHPYLCDLCGKQFRVSEGLSRHLKETHQRIKNFKCDLCGRCFATKRSAEEHRRIHTNERPYICALCGKMFKQQASLFIHNRSHNTEKPFGCTHCTRTFHTKQLLITHITRHTREKSYICDVCQRPFSIMYELKQHKLVHSEEKPFSCSICKKTFRQKRYLRSHLLLNHNTTNPNELIEK